MADIRNKKKTIPEENRKIPIIIFKSKTERELEKIYKLARSVYK